MTVSFDDILRNIQAEASEFVPYEKLCMVSVIFLLIFSLKPFIVCFRFLHSQHSNESTKSSGKRHVSVQSKALYGVGAEEELVSCVLPGITIAETLKKYLPQLCKSFQVCVCLS